MCSNCVNRLYSSGSAKCPFCGTSLKKSNFSKPLFEDLVVEKECRIRKRVWKIYHKEESEFDDLRSYNDHLERVEDIIFDLIADKDIQRVNAKIDELQKTHQEDIVKNTRLEEHERLLVEAVLKGQQKDQHQRKLQDALGLKQQIERKAQQHQAQVQQLTSGKTPVVVKQSQPEVKPDVVAAVSLQERLQKAQKAIEVEPEKPITPVERFFKDPLESPYQRSDIQFDRCQDPAVESFATDIRIAGGYQPRVVYRKSLEASIEGLLV